MPLYVCTLYDTFLLFNTVHTMLVHINLDVCTHLLVIHTCTCLVYPVSTIKGNPNNYVQVLYVWGCTLFCSSIL